MRENTGITKSSGAIYLKKRNPVRKVLVKGNAEESMPNTLLIIDDDLAVQNIINAEIAIDMIILVMLKLQSILKNDCFSMKIPIQMRANIIDNKRDGNRHEEIDSLSLDAVIAKKKNRADNAAKM